MITKIWTKSTLNLDELEEIKKLTEEAFKGFRSENQKQKLVYKLLNAVKVNNQREFFWLLLRTLNSDLKKEVSQKLARKINEVFPVSSADFEKIAYSIILGIITSGGGNNE